VFDSNVEVATSIRRESGEQEVAVRFPSDDEWVARSRKWQIVQQRLGRGMTETQIDTAGADAALYNVIRLNGSPDLSAAEASQILKLLSRCEITDVDLGSGSAVVSMTVMNGEEVTIDLKIPTTAEVGEFQRSSARVYDLPHGRQHIRLNLQATEAMWKRCFISAAGYREGTGVPLIHRDAAVRAVIDACERRAEAPKGEDF
jgi:hypothetical protein